MRLLQAGLSIAQYADATDNDDYNDQHYGDYGDSNDQAKKKGILVTSTCTVLVCACVCVGGVNGKVTILGDTCVYPIIMGNVHVHGVCVCVSPHAYCVWVGGEGKGKDNLIIL